MGLARKSGKESLHLTKGGLAKPIRVRNRATKASDVRKKTG